MMHARHRAVPAAPALLALLALAPAATPAQAPSVDDQPLLVIDADHKVLGRFENGHVVMKVRKGRVTIPLVRLPHSTRLGWGDDGGQYILFHSPDCSGRGYLSQGSPPASAWGTLPALLQGGGGHVWLYVADDMAPRQVDGHAGSYLQNGACTEDHGRHIDAAWVFSDPPVDLATLYTPPFTVK